MATDDPVPRALAVLAEADASRKAPALIESAVLDAFARHLRESQGKRHIEASWGMRFAATVGCAAVALTSVYFVKWRRPLVEPPPRLMAVQSSVSGTLAPAALSETRELPASPPRSTMIRRHRRQPSMIRPSPHPSFDQKGTIMEGDAIAQVVQLRIPRAALPSFGVPIIDPDATGMVNLEVLLDGDGFTRAIRVAR